MKPWLFLLAFALPGLSPAASLQPLNADAVDVLLQPPARGERFIALWSLDCAYCEANMQTLARLQQAHPERIELVTVATDNIAQRDAISARLDAAGMEQWPARAYADTTPDRINYLIDPQWGGEMPRTLVIRADGSRRGLSGALTPEQLAKLR
jgi:thiol-disulfide isomerase/thioredoxin